VIGEYFQASTDQRSIHNDKPGVRTGGDIPGKEPHQGIQGFCLPGPLEQRLSIISPDDHHLVGAFSTEKTFLTPSTFIGGF